MSKEESLVLILTFILSVIAIFLIAHKARQGNSNTLKSLLWVIVSYNSIWYAVLLLQLWGLQLFDPANRILSIGFQILLSTLLFTTRILFFLAFYRMLIKIVDLNISKYYSLVLKLWIIIIFVLWILGWVEAIVQHRSGIMEKVMNYTDILIIFSIIMGCIYLIYKSKSVRDLPSQKALQLLGVVFIVPLFFGFFKWIIAGSFGVEITEAERLSIPFLMFLSNALIIWWVIYYSGKLNGTVIFRIDKAKPDQGDLMLKYNITKREMEVIDLICEGYTNKDIADKLFISIDTVKDHNSRIFQKTGIKNRTQLANLFSN